MLGTIVARGTIRQDGDIIVSADDIFVHFRTQIGKAIIYEGESLPEAVRAAIARAPSRRLQEEDQKDITVAWIILGAEMRARGHKEVPPQALEAEAMYCGS